MERKTCTEHGIKITQDGSGSFEGYASVFGNFDRVNEAVVKDAFKNIESFTEEGFGAIGHDWNGLPIATIAYAKQDEVGLYIKADFHSTPEAQNARTVIQERLARGKSVGLSIGYEVNDSEYVPEGRLLKALTLFEVSVVTIPANPLAGVNTAKDYSPTNLSLDEHSALMLANAKAYVARLNELHSLRQKDGRGLSQSRREELAAIKQVIDEAYTATSPLADSAKVRSAYAKYLALTSLANKGESNEQTRIERKD